MECMVSLALDSPCLPGGEMLSNLNLSNWRALGSFTDEGSSGMPLAIQLFSISLISFSNSFF